MSKSVDEKTFKECVDMMLSGRMHPDVAAYLTGLSRPTFNRRVNEYYDPEVFGELPEGFFNGYKGKFNENPKWIRDSVAVKRYKERQEEKKRRKEYREEHIKYLKEKNTFKTADKLPDLGD